MWNFDLGLAAAGLCLCLGLGAACDADDDDDGLECGDGDTSCQLPRPPDDDGDETPAPSPPRCAAACANLLGGCDAIHATAGDGDGEPGGSDCERECRGDFTAAEVDCLADLACGAPSDGCFG